MGMALSLLAWTGTSSNVLWSVSNQVPPDGKGTLCGTAMVCVKKTSMANNRRQSHEGTFGLDQEARGCRQSIIGLGIDMEMFPVLVWGIYCGYFSSCLYITF